jgi:subtilase family serine protease
VVRTVRLGFALCLLGGAIALCALLTATGTSRARLPLPQPAVSDWAFVSSSETPPSQAQCFSAGRRCFAPQGIQSAYHVGPLYDQGLDGSGVTIAIVDSYGSDTITHDLHVFDQAFGLQPMCGEEAVTCQPGMPTFSRLALQGTPATKAPPSTSNAPGQENKAAWALEVSLDVERAHAVAPGANILLVTTPTAETLGVQGFPQMVAAEDYVVQHHLAQVISQSFGAAEESFASTQSLLRLRYAYQDAEQNGVTVLASAGDFGTANPKKEPVSQGGTTIPFPTVSWPASDPLVTGVGGTALCTDPNATGSQPRTVDSADPPAACQAEPGQAEIVWDEPSRGIATGGGFSHVFDNPANQDTLPAGSTSIGATRGVPDIGLQASPRTGVLVYMTLSGAGNGGLGCGSSPCSTGWYDVGGTSASAPQWAGLVAMADQLNGGGLGLINPALYKIGSDSTKYANDFYDITVGNNQVDPSIAGYPATTGWDPTTGLGTPNAANLVPDLVAASH